MNIEQLEHLLSQYRGREVIIVRPDFGTVSFSFSGTLDMVANEEGVRFHVVGPVAIMFSAGDVANVEDSNTAPASKVIRLKPPHEPSEHWKA